MRALTVQAWTNLLSFLIDWLKLKSKTHLPRHEAAHDFFGAAANRNDPHFTAARAAEAVGVA